MLSPDASSGNVLLLTDSPERGERLGRWIATTGERPVVLSGAEKFLMETGDDESIDLLVTDLDTDDPAARGLMDRLATGELFRDVPQLHVFRDLAFRDHFLAGHPSQAALAMAAPPEAEGFQARVRLASEIGRLRRELARGSIRDPMTGLFNRRYLMLRLEEEFSRARRHRTPLSLLLLDIDHLKKINDAFGLVAGDTVIRKVAQTIRAQVRREDLLGRTGEESFGILLANNRYRGAAILANKIRSEVEELLLQFRGESFQVRISAGVSAFPDNPSIRGADDLVRTTEDALAAAKSRGGNRVAVDEGILRRDRRVVLVADPDPTLLDLAEDLLGLDDLLVARAENAAAALAAVAVRPPDLLVVDLGLAESEGGAPFLERLQRREGGRRVPVIALAREAGADPDALARLGVDRFLTKPFSVSLLRGLAQELLDAYRPS